MHMSLKFGKRLILKIEMHIGLHSSWDTDLGLSIAVVTDNINAINVVKPVYGNSTFPPTTKAV